MIVRRPLNTKRLPSASGIVMLKITENVNKNERKKWKRLKSREKTTENQRKPRMSNVFFSGCLATRSFFLFLASHHYLHCNTSKGFAVRLIIFIYAAGFSRKTHSKSNAASCNSSQNKIKKHNTKDIVYTHGCCYHRSPST